MMEQSYGQVKFQENQNAEWLPILEHQSDLGTGANGHLTLKYEHMFVEINKIAFKIHVLPFISTELFQETKC